MSFSVSCATGLTVDGAPAVRIGQPATLTLTNTGGGGDVASLAVMSCAQGGIFGTTSFLMPASGSVQVGFTPTAGHKAEITINLLVWDGTISQERSIGITSINTTTILLRVTGSLLQAGETPVIGPAPPFLDPYWMPGAPRLTTIFPNEHPIGQN